MKKLNRFLRNAFDKKIDGTGLAIFRIVYAIILLFEIAQFFYFRHLMFDKVPYIEVAEIKFSVPIGIWFISMVLILFGLFTRFATILNYIMSLILIATIGTYEYHVFYAYMGINFVFIFLPISQCLSLDRLIKKLKYSNTTYTHNPTKKISQLYYFVPVFVAIALIYFDSVFVKLTANSWITGLGMWLPSSMPMMAKVNLTPILNQKYLLLFLGYLTLAFEISFIFLFFRKKLRLVLFTIGVSLHIGIGIIFPIPWFALTYCGIYLLLIPVSFWKKCLERPKHKNPKLQVFIDSECPLCVRTKIAVSHFNSQNNIAFKTVQFDAKENQYLKDFDQDILLNDIHAVSQSGNVYSGVDTYIQILSKIWYFKPISLILRLPGIKHIAKNIYAYIAKNRNTERCTEESCGYNPPPIIKDEQFKILNNFTLNDLKFLNIKYILFLFVILQSLIISDSPLISKIWYTEGEEMPLIKKITSKVSRYAIGVGKPLFGITSHNVFIDRLHFNGYNHIIAFVYVDENNNETFLPYIDENGQPDIYNYGTNWRKVSFDTNSPFITKKRLYPGVRDLTAFWAHKNNIDLNNAKFLIKVKKIDTPTGWEKDFLNRQIAKPWIDGGYVLWKNERIEYYIKDIESL